MSLKDVIEHKFKADTLALKEAIPASYEFEYFWDCLEAYKKYHQQKKYYEGFSYKNGQGNKED